MTNRVAHIILITGHHPLSSSLKVLAVLAVIWLATRTAEWALDHHPRTHNRQR